MNRWIRYKINHRLYLYGCMTWRAKSIRRNAVGVVSFYCYFPLFLVSFKMSRWEKKLLTFLISMIDFFVVEFRWDVQ